MTIVIYVRFEVKKFTPRADRSPTSSHISPRGFYCLISNLMHYRYLYRAAKKVSPKIVCCFFDNCLEFLREFLHLYVAILSTLNCQVAFNNL